MAKIHEAIEHIQKEVGNIPKNGELRVGGQLRYTFVKNDDILAKINELLVKERVIVKPEISDVREASRDIGAGKVLPTVYLTLEQTYIAVEDGSEFKVRVAGEGGGADDKGLRKAVTQAQKIANLLTFSIVTGEEDPDAQEPKINDAPKAAPAPAAPRDQEIRDEIKGLLDGADNATIKVKAEEFAKSKGKGLPAGWGSDVTFLTAFRDSLKA